MSYEIKRKRMKVNSMQESHGIAQLRQAIRGTERAISIAKAQGRNETARNLKDELRQLQKARHETRGKRRDAAEAVKLVYENIALGSQKAFKKAANG